MTVPGAEALAATGGDGGIERPLAGRLPDSAWMPAAVALVGGFAFIVVRLIVAAGGDAGEFVLAGDVFSDPDRAGVHVFRGPGYDGQFFYRLARGVFDVAPHAHGVAVDSALRFQRITYPVVVWILSGGGRVLVPWVLIAVNLGALATLGWLGGLVARASGRHALWGALLPAYFGLVFSLSRDLSEIVEVTLLVGGFVALRYLRPWVAALLLTGAVLSRETALFAVAGMAAARLVVVATRRDRLDARDAAWILPPIGFAAWQAIEYLRIDTVPATSTHGNEFVIPGSRLIASIDDLLPHLSYGRIVHLAELIVLLAVCALAALSLGDTTAPLPERCAFVALILGALSVDITEGLWITITDFRMFADVYALAVLVLLGCKRNLAPVAIAVILCSAGAAASMAHSV